MSDFANLIKTVIDKGNIDEPTKNLLIKNIAIYEEAFTSPSINKVRNYEMFEHLGDATVNKFLVSYFIKRFPQLDCPSGVKIVARLKINYASKQSFYTIANNLGFWPFIVASPQVKATKKKALLEDVLEAFIGATEYIIDSRYQHTGIGYVVVARVLKQIFDRITISLAYEDLYDPKSRIKEYFDKNKHLGTLEFVYKAKKKLAYIYKQNKKCGKTQLLMTGTGNLKSYAEQDAAMKLLNKLNVQIPDDYVFCDKPQHRGNIIV